MRSPWWQGLDLRVLRHVRGVLRRRGLELTLVEKRPTEPAAFAALSTEEMSGPGLAVIALDEDSASFDLLPRRIGSADIIFAMSQLAAPPTPNVVPIAARLSVSTIRSNASSM